MKYVVAKNDKWKRKRQGLYELQKDGGVYQVEYIPKEDSDRGKASWICRFNGVAFDNANTLQEAKEYCHT